MNAFQFLVLSAVVPIMFAVLSRNVSNPDFILECLVAANVILVWIGTLWSVVDRASGCLSRLIGGISCIVGLSVGIIQLQMVVREGNDKDTLASEVFSTIIGIFIGFYYDGRLEVLVRPSTLIFFPMYILFMQWCRS